MPEPQTPPPIGAAPENEDFTHPWLISGIVSTLCFAVGFVLLYVTGWWSNLWQWADVTFIVYAAILTPVLLGFYCYGVYLALQKLFRKPRTER
ncbi:MAG: hypothetical protein JO270_20080 [Acidobacteriaceae bacterium]|nr:hypothetical protein [Acidobacteriaceae bacterium]